MNSTMKIVVGVLAGVCLGLTVTIVTAHFWFVPLAAVCVGLVTGLYTGYWVGATKQARQVHQSVVISMFGESGQTGWVVFKKFLWEVLTPVLWFLFRLYGVLAAFVGGVFLMSQFIFSLDLFWDDAVVFSSALSSLVSAMVMLGKAYLATKLEIYDSSRWSYRLFFAGEYIEDPVARYDAIRNGEMGRLRTFTKYFMLPLLGLLWPVVMVAIVGLCVFGIGVIILIVLMNVARLCYNHQTAAITVGVVIGFFTGLAVGGVEGVGVYTLLRECVIGSAAGILVSLAFLLFGRRVVHDTEHDGFFALSR